MSRVLRIELRRSAALGAGLVVLLAGAVLLHATPGRWSSGWMALAMTQREYLVLMLPFALAAGAWQGRRDTRSGLVELLGSTPRPRPQQVLPALGALGAAVALGYLAVLPVTAPRIAGTASYLPLAAFGVVAIGVVAVVAASWLGTAVGRLWPSVAAGPVLAVAGVCWLTGLGTVVGTRWVSTLFSPMQGMSVYSDYDTVPGRLTAAQACWLVGLAAGAYVLHAARSRRGRMAALLPLALGVASAVVVVPHSAGSLSAIDPVAQELVCTPDAPRVCVARVHEGLLPEVAPAAREALALLAELPDPPAEAHEDTIGPSRATPGAGPRVTPSDVVPAEPDPAGTALLTLDVDRDGHLARPDQLVTDTVSRVLSNRGGCPEMADPSVVDAAAYWLADREPVPVPGVVDDGNGDEPVLQLWRGLRQLPEAEALARVRAVREGALGCSDVSGLLGPG